jgi:hypothetical protein
MMHHSAPSLLPGTQQETLPFIPKAVPLVPRAKRPGKHFKALPASFFAENPHEYYAGKDTAVPHVDKPDF